MLCMNKLMFLSLIIHCGAIGIESSLGIASLGRCSTFTGIEKLVLEKYQFVNNKRVAPRKELQCSGSSCRFGPKKVICLQSSGGSGWVCQDFGTSPNYTLAYDTIVCEGCSQTNDTEILRDSCGIIYNVIEKNAIEKNAIEKNFIEKNKISWMVMLVFGVFLTCAICGICKKICEQITKCNYDTPNRG